MGDLRGKESTKRLPRGAMLVRGRYRVRMGFEGKIYSIGVFDTLTDAKAAQHVAKADAARGVFVPPAERRAASKVQQVARRGDRLYKGGILFVH